MAKGKTAAPPRASLPKLQRELRTIEMELAIKEARYAERLIDSMTLAEVGPEMVRDDPDSANWIKVSEGGSLAASKDVTGPGIQRDLATVRRESYRMWRFNPHARGILRNFQKFIIGREFGLDFEDDQRGKWNEDRTKITVTGDEKDSLVVRLLWDDFEKRNKFRQRAKEIVLRTFRDGEMLLRRFVRVGKVDVRFIEPDHIGSQAGTVQPITPTVTLNGTESAKKTRISQGVEHLDDDVETVVAYHIQRGPSVQSERVPADEIIHLKCLADANDVRGVPFLEPVMRNLTNYLQWENYRLILNKVRTAVVFIRKVEGTRTQAQALVQGRLPVRASPGGDPQTTSGSREAMFRAGTALTPGPGVDYEFKTPNLEARDAAADGRTFLLSIAAGVGLPEMLVTASWETTNFACHDSETEILTARGWLRYEVLCCDDLVATVNAAGVLEYQHPTRIHQYPYDGEMVRISGADVDLLVTPNHRLWVCSKGEDNLGQRWQFVEAGAWDRDVAHAWAGAERADGMDLLPVAMERGQFSRVPYSGVVWCVTVSNGLIVTRRHGTVAVHGNSAVTAQDPAVREWEDWQDVFQPVFEQVFEWVIEAAIDEEIVPATTDRRATVQWPNIIQKDALKETERRLALVAAGLMSRKTASAQENLDHDAEQLNMREEDEFDRELRPGAPRPDPGAGVPSLAPDDDGGAGTGSGGTAPATEAALRANDYLLALRELEEGHALAVEHHPELADTIERYLVAARLLGFDEARGPLQIQTLIFAKGKFDADAARAWAEKHGFASDKVDENGESIRLRQRSPGTLKTFRTIGLTTGVQAVVAK